MKTTGAVDFDGGASGGGSGGASGGTSAGGASSTAGRGGGSGGLASGGGLGAGGALAPFAAWANWPMPNQTGRGLPNERRYTALTVGADDVVRDDVTGLTWQRLLSPSTFVWQAAVDYCDALTLAGEGDWRLPSRIELVSLLDLALTDPAIDRVAFPGTPGEWFWTASRQAGQGTKAWYVYFYFGYPDTDDAQNAFRARCVRTSSPGVGGRYDVQADTVRDAATRLTWQRAVSTGGRPLASAAQYCGDLALGGHDDWRLPSLQELQTIVDETRANPPIDPVAFPDTPIEGFWTGTAWSGTPALAWHVDFDVGGGAYDSATMAYRVRCVRWGD